MYRIFFYIFWNNSLRKVTGEVMQIYPTNPVGPILGGMDEQGELGKELRSRWLDFPGSKKVSLKRTTLPLCSIQIMAVKNMCTGNTWKPALWRVPGEILPQYIVISPEYATMGLMTSLC